MKRIFNIILFALFCTSFAQAQVGKTFEFTYEGQTLKYKVANGNEAKVSKQQSAKISGDVKIPERVKFEGEKFRVTTIGESAFCHCKGLTSVTIPNSVTTIGMMAFGLCTGLTSVTIPNSVTTIGVGAFAGCENLKSINVAKDNSHYCSENGVLFDITKKRLIQCPCGIKGNYAIPDGVTTIGDAAFGFCESLTSVTIPNSVTTIGESAFGACVSLKSINVVKNNLHYCSENGVLFDITKKTLIQCPCGIKGNYAIPDGVTTIGKGAFVECKGLTSITIPNSVTTIDELAFGSCKGLTSVSIPNSVTTIGKWAFMECKGLTTVTIPNSVTTIGMEAFRYCIGLTLLTIENATPPVVEGLAFKGVSENMTIYVPAESVEKYKTADGWSRYADKIKAIEK